MSWRPLDPRWGVGPDSRRWELFTLAAPVFRRHGFRGATVKALAHACHLSPAALYHWFPSKAALATFHVDRAAMGWGDWSFDPTVDPLTQLAGLIDLSLETLPDVVLSIELARELGRRVDQRGLARIFGEGEALYGRLLLAAAPVLGEAGARELGRRLLAILAAPVSTGLDPEPAAVRARAIDLLRVHLTSVGVSADRLEATLLRA